MFSSPAFAQTAGTPPNDLVAFMASPLGLIIPMFLIVYLLMIRPQQKRLKDHRSMIDGVKKGDTVVTGGGLIGKVTRVDDDEIEVELAPNTRVKALKSTLSDVRTVAGKPAND
jgi:preprotein translocase subunit YajC